LPKLFEEFLYRRIPEDDTFLITIIGGKFYRSSPRALPDILRDNSDLMEHWQDLQQQEQKDRVTNDPNLGNILYLAQPIYRQGKVQGVLVVAHTTEGEVQEARKVIAIVIRVLLSLLVIALLLAWIVSGKVLAPLRSLNTTARAIGETDLTQRLPVQGTGELADLAVTFNEMMDRLQSAFTSQQAFLNDAGHELRTPLTIIRGHLELMGDSAEERAETLFLVLDELDRMSRIVDDLLLLAKSERPDFLRLERVDIGELTREWYAKIVPLGDRHWVVEEQGEGTIEGDRQRLTQAFLNLAVNASQHTDRGDTIAIGSHRDRSCVRFWVRDTGRGIAPEERERIFERFARGHRRHSSGAGLGLSIVRAIALAHGGRIEVDSELGIGSTFTIVLPVSGRSSSIR
jgi:signal transduction histidine kinase